MLRVEIEKRIKEIEKAQFMLAMKDHWTIKDYNTDDRLYAELKELKKKLH